jgi:hypothetical protein
MPFGFFPSDNSDWAKRRGLLSEARHQVTNRGEPRTTLPEPSPGRMLPTDSFAVTTGAIKMSGSGREQCTLGKRSRCDTGRLFRRRRWPLPPQALRSLTLCTRMYGLGKLHRLSFWPLTGNINGLQFRTANNLSKSPTVPR